MYQLEMVLCCRAYQQHWQHQATQQRSNWPLLGHVLHPISASSIPAESAKNHINLSTPPLPPPSPLVCLLPHCPIILLWKFQFSLKFDCFICPFLDCITQLYIIFLLFLIFFFFFGGGGCMNVFCTLRDMGFFLKLFSYNKQLKPSNVLIHVWAWNWVGLCL